MESIKSEALKAISSMPETASVEDIMYQLFVIEKIRKGQDAIRRGEFIPAKQLLNEIDTW